MRTTKKHPEVAQPAAKRLITLRINPQRLTEDELDYLYYIKHKEDPSYSFEELLHKLGYEMGAEGKKRS